MWPRRLPAGQNQSVDALKAVCVLAARLPLGARDVPDVPELQKCQAAGFMDGVSYLAPTLVLSLGVDAGPERIALALRRNLSRLTVDADNGLGDRFECGFEHIGLGGQGIERDSAASDECALATGGHRPDDVPVVHRDHAQIGRVHL